jgi:3-oxoacyl-[acyl-carrier protein] reductase
MPPPNSSIYSATKAAVDNLILSLSKELGSRKIRVNSLDLGLIETEGTQSQGILESDFRDSQVKNTPLGRIGLPEDIGPIAVFLASDTFLVNGTKLLAGGGVTM